jgi:serine protease AprX
MSNLTKILIIVVVFSILFANTGAAPDKISLKVRSLMEIGEEVPIIIILKDQSSFHDPSPENVVSSLKRHASTSQNGIASFINDEKTKGNADTIKQFWIVNALSFHASPELIERLAKRDDIASIELDSRFAAQENYFAQIDNATSEIKHIHAPEAWELGITGKGINVSILDTGINPSHPDIAGRLIKWNDTISHLSSPYDNHGHGTHVAGTVAGNGSGGITTGVAPEANLFGVKVLDGTGSGIETDVIDGIQWSIENNADIISMSLGSNQTWTTPNCDAYDPFMAMAINNANDAGTVVVVAAGNTPSGVTSPGCIAGAIAVGAVDSSDTIASFSGRGSAMIDHGFVAPGYGITSLNCLNSGYIVKNGTSMATPHVSGTIADLLQAARNQGLALSPAQVKSVLENTSVDLGTAGRDNVYGAGRIDVFIAIREYATSTINGTVLDTTSRAGIADVIVNTNTSISTVTNAAGFYSFTVLAGTYDLTARSDPKYITNNTITISTIGKMFVEQDIELVGKPTGTIRGSVTT